MRMKSSWDTARNVLCVRLDHMGDVLMTTPALRALKQQNPHRRLTLLASSNGFEVGHAIPEVDEVMRYDAPWHKSAPLREASDDYAAFKALIDRRFDAAAIFTVYSQSPLPSALMCFLAGIPLRLAHCRENPYQLLTHWIQESEPHQRVRHEVQRQLDLVATVGCHTQNQRLSFHVPPIAGVRVTKLLEQLGVNLENPWLVIHPGATALSRRYPPQQFASAARRLSRDLNYQVVFTGALTEQSLVEQIRTDMRLSSYSLVGKLNLTELAALISMSCVLICNNTGPAHLAAAVETPVVDLYALTNPQHTPWHVPNRVLSHDVPCKYCYKSVCPQGHNDCLRLVTPDQIVMAVQELMREKRRSNLIPFPIKSIGKRIPIVASR
ncbi:MAG TPA: lipopolysaccharide heptosyltransferase II [Burkholderiales bacterium]|nr:lipopolysaccharide heptosyltransferase II [Burkholderiales bacterium]